MKKVLCSIMLIISSILLCGCGNSNAEVANVLESQMTRLVNSVAYLDSFSSGSLSSFSSYNNLNATSDLGLATTNTGLNNGLGYTNNASGIANTGINGTCATNSNCLSDPYTTNNVANLGTTNNLANNTNCRYGTTGTGAVNSGLSTATDANILNGGLDTSTGDGVINGGLNTTGANTVNGGLNTAGTDAVNGGLNTATDASVINGGTNTATAINGGATVGLMSGNGNARNSILGGLSNGNRATLFGGLFNATTNTNNVANNMTTTGITGTNGVTGTNSTGANNGIAVEIENMELITANETMLSTSLNDLSQKRGMIMLYCNGLRTGKIVLTATDISAINEYMAILQDTTNHFLTSTGTLTTNLNNLTTITDIGGNVQLINARIVRANEILNTRYAKIEAASAALDGIINILASRSVVDYTGQNTVADQTALNGSLANTNYDNTLTGTSNLGTGINNNLNGTLDNDLSNNYGVGNNLNNNLGNNLNNNYGIGNNLNNGINNNLNSNYGLDNNLTADYLQPTTDVVPQKMVVSGELVIDNAQTNNASRLAPNIGTNTYCPNKNIVSSQTTSINNNDYTNPAYATAPLSSGPINNVSNNNQFNASNNYLPKTNQLYPTNSNIPNNNQYSATSTAMQPNQFNIQNTQTQSMQSFELSPQRLPLDKPISTPPQSGLKNVSAPLDNTNLISSNQLSYSPKNSQPEVNLL